MTEPQNEQEIARLLRIAGERPKAGAERTARVRDAVHAEWRSGVAARARRRRTVGSLLAAAVVIVAVAATLWRSSESIQVAHVAIGIDGIVAGEPIAVGRAIQTPPSRVLVLTMASGHSVRLHGGSRLEVVGPRSLELLAGAVYVDSGPDHDGEGISVLTPQGPVEEIGTQFEVRLHEESVRVRVREGRVRVRGAQVEAGEQVTVRAGIVSAPTAIDIHGASWDWVMAAATLPDLEGLSAQEFLGWAAREGGWRLEKEGLSSYELAEIRLSGSIEGLTLVESLEVVLPSCGLSHRIQKGALIVSRP